MSRRSALVACLVLGGISTPPAHPCSSFAQSGPDEVLLAKNFDWHFGSGYLVKNPGGVTRSALPLLGGEPAKWTSRHGSLTFTQYGAGLPYGGINQRGLAIEMLWLDETVYPAAAPPTIGELEWIQYQLDVHATVAEVLASVEEFSIRPIGGKIHYLLADASGERALVEFIDGRARVHRGGEGPLVCTNDTHTLSELAFAKLRTMKLDGTSSRVRYARLRLDLDCADRSAHRRWRLRRAAGGRGARRALSHAVVGRLRGPQGTHPRPDGRGPASVHDRPCGARLVAGERDDVPGPVRQAARQRALRAPDRGRAARAPRPEPAEGRRGQPARCDRRSPARGARRRRGASARRPFDAARPRSSRDRGRVRPDRRVPAVQRELARQDAPHVGSVLLDIDGAGVRVLQPPQGTVRRGGVPRSQPERPSRRRGAARLCFRPNPDGRGATSPTWLSS